MLSAIRSHHKLPGSTLYCFRGHRELGRPPLAYGRCPGKYLFPAARNRYLYLAKCIGRNGDRLAECRRLFDTHPVKVLGVGLPRAVYF